MAQKQKGVADAVIKADLSVSKSAYTEGDTQRFSRILRATERDKLSNACSEITTFERRASCRLKLSIRVWQVHGAGQRGRTLHRSQSDQYALRAN